MVKEIFYLTLYDNTEHVIAHIPVGSAFPTKGFIADAMLQHKDSYSAKIDKRFIFAGDRDE